eukprot:2313634-Rhodomonas_salina.1
MSGDGNGMTCASTPECLCDICPATSCARSDGAIAVATIPPASEDDGMPWASVIATIDRPLPILSSQNRKVTCLENTKRGNSMRCEIQHRNPRSREA